MVNCMGMTSVRMPDELLAKLDETAGKMRRSKGWIINDAVEKYLANEAKKAERLAQTYEALDDLENGRVVDGQAVLDWLDTWGSDTEVPRPE